MSSTPSRPPTRGITEGAILAGLTVITAAAGLVAPFVGVLVAPLPIMVLVIRWGIRNAVLATVVATLLLLQLFGPLNALSAAAGFAPLGLALGWGVRQGWTASLTVLAGATAFLAATLAALAGGTLILHQDLVGEFIRSQVKAMQMAVSFQERLGASRQQIDQLRATLSLLPGFLHAALPVIFALGALLWAYTCYTVARHVLRRIGHHLPGFPPLLEWRIPPAATAALLWLSAIMVVARFRAPQVGGAVLDIMLADLFIFGFQGALVAAAWMNRRQVPRALQIVLGAMLLSAGILPLLSLAVLGALDTWVDYRRLTSREGHGACDPGRPARLRRGGKHSPESPETTAKLQ